MRSAGVTKRIPIMSFFLSDFVGSPQRREEASDQTSSILGIIL
jgi:hypothetical protein